VFCGKSKVLRSAIEEESESPEVKTESCNHDAQVQVVLDNEGRELILVGHAD
jgi:hypothetical protein